MPSSKFHFSTSYDLKTAIYYMAQNISLALHELNYKIHVVNAFSDNNIKCCSDEMHRLELIGLKNVTL